MTGFNISFLGVKFIALCLLIFHNNLCWGQDDHHFLNSKLNPESFFNLKNYVIKQEIAYFNNANLLMNHKNDQIKIEVKEIPISYCSDTLVIFEKGNMFSLDKLVDIFTEDFDAAKHELTFDNNKLLLIDGRTFWGLKGNVPKTKIKAIRMMHVKHRVIIPDSAFVDLFEPNSCSRPPISNKGEKEQFLSNIKVFESRDKRRVYINMVNGSGSNRYEVTLVIENCAYLMRIIDEIPDLH